MRGTTMREQPGRDSGLFAAVFGTLADAVQDVRSKLIDEGWFGRRGVSPERTLAQDWGGPTIHQDLMARPSFEEAWAPRAGEPSPVEPGGLDLDR